MSRLTIIYFISLSLIIFSSSCRQDEIKDDKATVSVSVLPQKYLVDKISGKSLNVNVLIPPGASPASYEASPRQIAQMENSLIYFRIGHIIFEKTWIENITNENPELKVINLSDGIELIGIESSDDIEAHGHSVEKEHRHVHGSVDPHIWMSPKNMEIIAHEIFTVLSELMPEDVHSIENNYMQLRSQIKEIDSLFLADHEILNGLDFLIYHPALAYLAKDYGMNQYVLESDGKEPGPAHFASIIDLAKEKEIKYIFIQEQFDRNNAIIIASEINAEVIEIDPLDENWYEQMIKIHTILTEKK